MPFLEQIRALGRRAPVHKGISGPIPGAGLATGSPRDIGPLPCGFPTSRSRLPLGYEPDPDGEEGAYTEQDRGRGVNRFIATLEEAGIGASANVYAELGSTWFMMMRKPREAAHVLGKLLRAVGPDRIVWGTDCIWYGSPQPLIDSFRAFTIPEDMQQQFGYPALTADIKAKILGTNAASVITGPRRGARGGKGRCAG